MKFTPGPYNANIGPGGPDMNKVGFKRVQAYVKAKMSPFMATGQNGPISPTGPMVTAQPMIPAPMVSNVVETNPTQISADPNVIGFKGR